MNKRPNEFGRFEHWVLWYGSLCDNLRRSRLHLVRNELLAIGWRHGLVIIEALNKTATEVFKEINLVLRFNALDNHGQLDLLHQTDSRLHDFAAAFA